MMTAVYVLGRICVPIVFIAAGIQKVTDVASIARVLVENNVPVPDEISSYLGGMPKYEAMGYLVAAVEIIGGLMVLFGVMARWGALLLAVFTALTIIYVHHFWCLEGIAAQMNQTAALKNLSIIGGLLLIVAAGARGTYPERRVQT